MMSFKDRLIASGLHPKDTDLPGLEALVKDLDRAAAAIDMPRPYAEEPLSSFRLPPP